MKKTKAETTFDQIRRDLGFNEVGKLYVATSDRYKLNAAKGYKLAHYIFGQYGIMVENERLLNPDAMVLRVNIGPHSRVNELCKADLPFCVRRIFKSGHDVLKHENFLSQCAGNFMGLMKEKYLAPEKVYVQVNCDDKKLKKFFLEKCFYLLDTHPEIYQHIDFDPKEATVFFNIQRIMLKGIITWVEGPRW